MSDRRLQPLFYTEDIQSSQLHPIVKSVNFDASNESKSRSKTKSTCALGKTQGLEFYCHFATELKPGGGRVVKNHRCPATVTAH